MAHHLTSLSLERNNLSLVTGGTDNHLILIDLRNKKVNGRVAALALEKSGIVLNYNGVPGDIMPPLYASGIRLGTPAITTRGMKEKDMEKIGDWYEKVIKEVEGMELSGFDKIKRGEMMKKYRVEIAENKKLAAIAKDVKLFCTKFPVP